MAERKTALVTGASRGIGRALARALCARGYKVFLASRDDNALRALKDELEAAHPGQAEAVVLDVAQCDETVRLIRRIDEACGGLDMVVANAGVGAAPGHSRLAWESMAEAMHTNFCGAAATLTAVLPKMVERGRGHLVGIGSLASYGALPQSAAYCSPKAGLSMLLECLKMDLVGSGVAVTEVKLGFVRTAAVAQVDHALPQLMEAEDVAHAISELLGHKPERIVMPRLLGALAKGATILPSPIRRSLLWRLAAR